MLFHTSTDFFCIFDHINAALMSLRDLVTILDVQINNMMYFFKKCSAGGRFVNTAAAFSVKCHSAPCTDSSSRRLFVMVRLRSLQRPCALTVVFVCACECQGFTAGCAGGSVLQRQDSTRQPLDPAQHHLSGQAPRPHGFCR